MSDRAESEESPKSFARLWKSREFKTEAVIGRLESQKISDDRNSRADSASRNRCSVLASLSVSHGKK
jgi:hypothetical protein